MTIPLEISDLDLYLLYCSSSEALPPARLANPKTVEKYYNNQHAIETRSKFSLYSSSARLAVSPQAQQQRAGYSLATCRHSPSISSIKYHSISQGSSKQKLRHRLSKIFGSLSGHSCDTVDMDRIERFEDDECGKFEDRLERQDGKERAQNSLSLRRKISRFFERRSKKADEVQGLLRYSRGL